MANATFLLCFLLIFWFRFELFEDFDLVPLGARPISALSVAQAATVNLIVLSIRNFYALLVHPDCFVLLSSRLENIKVTEANAELEISTAKKRHSSKVAPLKLGLQKMGRFASKSVTTVKRVHDSGGITAIPIPAGAMSMKRVRLRSAGGGSGGINKTLSVPPTCTTRKENPTTSEDLAEGVEKTLEQEQTGNQVEDSLNDEGTSGGDCWQCTDATSPTHPSTRLYGGSITLVQTISPEMMQRT